jgi:hypothetical protein
LSELRHDVTVLLSKLEPNRSGGFAPLDEIAQLYHSGKLVSL